jgi:hypothetical protein
VIGSARGDRLMLTRTCFLAAGLLALVAAAQPSVAQEFKVEESQADFTPDKLKPKTILFTDHRNDELVDPKSGLIRFADWARVKPLQTQVLALYPGYDEPTVSVTLNGTTKTHKKKLHMYIAEARFELARAGASIDLSRYVTPSFLERMDPMIKHRVIGPDDVIPNKDAKFAYNRNPARRWCEGARIVICIQSTYRLEGKLPTGVMLVNKLRDSGKKIADVIEFQSEFRVVPAAEIDQSALAKVTGVDTPVAGVLEQNIFYVNEVMQYGKFMAVFQPSPADANKTVVTAYMALAVDTDLFEKKKEFENVPVLRNMVPAQVLAGNSSFNTGSSISAGLPNYARNQIKAIAGILERE